MGLRKNNSILKGYKFVQDIPNRRQIDVTEKFNQDYFSAAFSLYRPVNI